MKANPLTDDVKITVRKPDAEAGSTPSTGSVNRQPAISATSKVSIRYDRSRQVFEMLHKTGSEKFGGAWLAANTAIAEHAQSRVDISDPAVKELLSLCALRCLMRLKAEGYLPTEMRDGAPTTLELERDAIAPFSPSNCSPAPYYSDSLTTIYHGDARTILPQLAAADVLITDPVWPNCIVKLYGQDRPHAMLAEMFHALPQMPKRAAIHRGCDSDPRFLTAVPDVLGFFRVCWFKLARVGYKGRLLMTGDVAYLFGEPPKSRPGAHVIPGECMDADGKGKQSDHPCPRKLKHASWLVNWWSEEGETILDPFMGSGTTLVAAKASGRKSIGVEIEERFCEMAVRRLRQETLGLENCSSATSGSYNPKPK